MVGVRGFEPPAPASRRQCSTRLSYTPTQGENRLYQNGWIKPRNPRRNQQEKSGKRLLLAQQG